MHITNETIEYISELAKLEFNESEKEDIKQDLNNISKYVEIINELDTKGVKPLSHVFGTKNVFRNDQVTNREDRQKTLENAPSKLDGYIQVPKTIE